LYGLPLELSSSNSPAPAARSWRVCFCYALAAALLALLWQFLIVTFNYGGNWSALFCTGAGARVPPELEADTYRFETGGYDGQFYRYVAHDPFFTKGYDSFQDGAHMRYRRILLPLAAWLLAAGQAPLVDTGYFAAVLLAVALGAWFLGRYAVLHGRHPAWGLVFVALPATLISLDRMTVDIALLTCCAAAAWYARRDASVRLWFALALAVLARETGALLIAAACLHALWRRQFRRAVLLATSVLPAFLWFQFLSAQLPHSPRAATSFFPNWLLKRPVVGIVEKMFRPESYPLEPALLLVARGADVLALAGLLLAFALALWRLLRRQLDFETFASLAFVGLLALISTPGYWADINGWGRVIAPLPFFVALPAMARGPLLLWLPLVLIDLRLGIQFGSQALGILRGLF